MPSHEPKPAKAMPKKNVKKPISPDTKLEVPSGPFQPDEQPMKASGPSSGSKGGVRPRRDPQPKEESEAKQEPKVEVKVEEKKVTLTKRNIITCTSADSWQASVTNWTFETTCKALSHVNWTVQEKDIRTEVAKGNLWQAWSDY